MKKKSAAPPESSAAGGRISRYQRYLDRLNGREGKTGGKGAAPGSEDSYKIIAQAIRVMLRET